MKTYRFITFIQLCFFVFISHLALAQDSETLEQNKIRTAFFLEEYRKQPGVIVMPNGIMYKVIKQGDGPKPEGQDSIAINVSLKYIDGSEIRLTNEGEHPMKTWLPGLNPADRSVIEQMQAGSIWEVVIPPQLEIKAFAESNLAIIEIIELVSVTKKVFPF